jgi:hypothetical protein
MTMQNLNKLILAIITSVTITAIGASAKAYVDVERLKLKVEVLFDFVKETRDDVKEIKKYLLNNPKK